MKKLALLLLLLGCDDATTVVVDNAYTDDTLVDEVWWSQTLVPDQVVAAGQSPSYRAVPANQVAYAVLERGGVPFVAQTTLSLGVERGAELHVVIGPTTIIGDCAASQARLTQAQADLITQSIFPGRFAGTEYDAATCKLFNPNRDAGPD